MNERERQNMVRALGRTILLLPIILLPLLAQNSPEAGKEASQPPTAKPVPPPASPDANPAVAPDAPVITIHGLCAGESDQPADSSSCTTVVPRRQFDSIVSAANVSGQQVTALARQNLAKAYVTYLAFEQAARKAGFENTAQFEEIMRFARLRAITDAYRGKIVEDARTATQPEIDAYYKDHIALFDRIEIIRVAIPRNNPTAPDDAGFDHKALEAASSARQRILRGDDADQVQKDAYATLHLPAVPPVDVGTRKRSSFSHELSDELFSLEVGSVSKVEIGSSSYEIYKVISHQPLDETKVQDQIVRSIAEDKVKAAFQSILNSVRSEYDPTYFGPPQEPPPPAH